MQAIVIIYLAHGLSRGAHGEAVTGQDTANRLKPGTLEAFHRVVSDQAVPMLRAWQTDVVTHGPPPQEPDGCTLLCAYKDPEDRQARQDAFDGAPGWRLGPREAVAGAIETHLSSLIRLSPAAIDELRAVGAAAGRCGRRLRVAPSKPTTAWIDTGSAHRTGRNWRTVQALGRAAGHAAPAGPAAPDA